VGKERSLSKERGRGEKDNLLKNQKSAEIGGASAA